jgi:hypothetical protein
VLGDREAAAGLDGGKFARLVDVRTSRDDLDVLERAEGPKWRLNPFKVEKERTENEVAILLEPDMKPKVEISAKTKRSCVFSRYGDGSKKK